MKQKNRLTYIVIILVISCLTGYRYTNSKQKEIYILGTVHHPTINVNSDSILRIIRQIKPSLILIESDSSNFDNQMNIKRYYEENEYGAVKQYLIEHPSTLIRPYDLNNRDEQRIQNGLYAEAGFAFELLNQMHSAGKFSQNDSISWNRFNTYWREYELLLGGTLVDLNAVKSEVIIDSVSYYQYIKTNNIIESYPIFTESTLIGANNDTITIKDYFKNWSDFEYHKRNNAMVQNIIKHIHSTKATRILVLTGIKHKSPLKKALSEKPNALRFKMIESY
ncbi:hypothetical protein ABN763_11855 [Spongiivirga sp. MCCC 1A20706]|uniref:hypothetical protein n=1 Tax=Spongiivirga sp. MCCC 1A20706 TaxID=3160963 RepID=UPI003977CCD8